MASIRILFAVSCVSCGRDAESMMLRESDSPRRSEWKIGFDRKGHDCHESWWRLTFKRSIKGKTFAGSKLGTNEVIRREYTQRSMTALVTCSCGGIIPCAIPLNDEDDKTGVDCYIVAFDMADHTGHGKAEIKFIRDVFSGDNTVELVN